MSYRDIHQKMAALQAELIVGLQQAKVDCGIRIKGRRAMLGMRQEDLCLHIGVTRPQVANMEAGRQWPHPRHLISLSMLFDVSIDWLLLGDRDSVGDELDR